MSSGEVPGGATGPISLWIGHTESTNVTRTTIPRRGSYDSFGAIFDVLHERSRLFAGLDGSAEYRVYGHDAAEDETVGFLHGFADALIVPERFTWSSEATYSQGRSNPFGADTPENRTNVVVVSTGPSANLPLGERTSLNLRSMRTDRNTSELGALDSDAWTHEVGISRQIRRTTEIGILAESSEIEYEQATANYKLQSVQLTYDRQLAGGEASIAAGKNKLTINGVETTGPLFQLLWQRALATRSSLTISAEHGFTDAGRLLEFGSGGVLAAPVDLLLTTDISEESRILAAYGLNLPRLRLLIQVASLKDQFQRDLALDGDATEFITEVSRPFTPALTLGATFIELRRDFENLDQENTDRTLALWLNRRLSQRVSLAVSLRSEDRQGLQDFKEEAYQISLLYSPRGARSAP